MGSMSAPDAAPLPRLGEVYFDVRGESRSMRLSWYADTEVAVFSIWQGGTCTGTFRLPMADLPRMIETLRRGPHGDSRAPADKPDSPRGAPEPPGRTGSHSTGQQDTPGYRPGHGPGRHGPRDGGRPGGPLAGGYRPGQRGGGYMDGPPAGGHPAGPVTGPSRGERDGGYPAGPADSVNDTGDYPASSGNAGYSPARPYVAPLPGGTGSPGEGRRHALGRPAKRAESAPSPDSFPYGGPPAEPEGRGRR
jgi:hypothetical protein